MAGEPNGCSYHLIQVDVVVDVEQVSPPIGHTIILVHSCPRVPERS
jgi:hypothetical protein